jgi:hypothetical protein
MSFFTFFPLQTNTDAGISTCIESLILVALVVLERWFNFFENRTNIDGDMRIANLPDFSDIL